MREEIVGAGGGSFDAMPGNEDKHDIMGHRLPEKPLHGGQNGFSGDITVNQYPGFYFPEYFPLLARKNIGQFPGIPVCVGQCHCLFRIVADAYAQNKQPWLDVRWRLGGFTGQRFGSAFQNALLPQAVFNS